MSVPTLLRAALALSFLPAAANISFGVASGDWNLNTNWGGGVIPVAGDTAIVNNGREAIVGSVVTPVPDIIPIGNNASGVIELVFSAEPSVPPPVLVPEWVGDTLRITSPSASEYAYQLQGSADLSRWENAGVPRNGTGASLLFETGRPATPGDKAFYRVVITEGGGGIVEGPPWDLEALFLQQPATTDTAKYAIPGLRSFFYGSLDWMGAPTRVYAYLGYPQGTPPDAGWPGVVLVHGGGGTAFHQWVKRWNARGFAAIAMDLEGRLPDLTVPTAERPTFEGSGPVRVGVWGDADLPPQQQWFYHAVAQAILAHNLLRVDAAVDAANIGIMGVSWGGIITCVAAGIDPRFRFAIPVYGCGFLPGSDAQMGTILATYSEARMERILAWWEPSRYLPTVTMPTLFVNSPNDTHFPINAWQQSIDAVPVPTWQSAQIGLAHGHTPPQLLGEPYAFAAAIVANQPASLPRLLPSQGDSGTITAEALLPSEPLAEVRLASTTASGTYKDRPWNRSSADLDAASLSAKLPAGAAGWFFEAVTHNNLLFTSPYREP